MVDGLDLAIDHGGERWGGWEGEREVVRRSGGGGGEVGLEVIGRPQEVQRVCRVARTVGIDSFSNFQFPISKPPLRD